jgi:hypothetical protein
VPPLTHAVRQRHAYVEPARRVGLREDYTRGGGVWAALAWRVGEDIVEEPSENVLRTVRAFAVLGDDVNVRGRRERGESVFECVPVDDCELGDGEVGSEPETNGCDMWVYDARCGRGDVELDEVCAHAVW